MTTYKKEITQMPIVTNMQQDSSMLSWFHKISDVLPVPKTHILPISTEETYEIIGLLDGNNISDALCQKIKDVANQIGYPLFLRSDKEGARGDRKERTWDERSSHIDQPISCFFYPTIRFKPFCALFGRHARI